MIFVNASFAEIGDDPEGRNCNGQKVQVTQIPAKASLPFVQLEYGASLLEQKGDVPIDGHVSIEAFREGSDICVRLKAVVETPLGDYTETATVCWNPNTPDCAHVDRQVGIVQIRGDLCIEGAEVCFERGEVSLDLPHVPWRSVPRYCVGLPILGKHSEKPCGCTKS